ncbi:hypothetical protein Y032_0141g2206 [Ancylostoma ceylanicum]|uniref:Uncharacterized protein n=1 Tax=Ancylostoma ceylanicum TaxID=53326 RepID=A0A016T407_9BILA|nr:hypothetical protein Y032_0141g2206 [Ancylostoma ceylanicum]
MGASRLQPSNVRAVLERNRQVFWAKEEPGFRGHERAARSRRGVRLDRLPSGPVFSPSCEDDSSELGSALVTSLWGLFYVMGTELCERNHCLLVENRRTNGTVEWSGINSIQRCK